jgi:hypothetical protein
VARLFVLEEQHIDHMPEDVEPGTAVSERLTRTSSRHRCGELLVVWGAACVHARRSPHRRMVGFDRRLRDPLNGRTRRTAVLI